MSKSPPRNAPCHCGSGRKFKLCHGRNETVKVHTGQSTLIVCVPTMGQISVQTHLALQSIRWAPRVMLFEERLPVIEARNNLATQALMLARDLTIVPKETIVLWVDSDAWFPPNTVQTLFEMFKVEKQWDAICGFFCARAPGAAPTAVLSDGYVPHPGVNCALGQIVPVVRAGFHLFAHRLSVLETLGHNPFGDQRNTQGEDFHFCDRMIEAGLRIGCATGLKVAHIDAGAGTAFYPGEPVALVHGEEFRSVAMEYAIPGAIQPLDEREYGLPEAVYSAANEEAKKWELRKKIAGIA